MIGQFAQAARYTFRFPEYTAEQHRRHGPSWPLKLPGAPPMVVTTDRDLIRRLLTGDPLVRRHANDILAPALGPGSILLLEPAPHLQRRKLLLPPFHGERIAGYRAIVQGLVDADLSGWPAGGEVAVHEWARDLTLRVIQRLVLGSEDAGIAARLVQSVDALSTPAANFGMFAPALGRRARWNPAAEVFYREIDRLNALMRELIVTARADPGLEAREDVLALLIRARDEDGHGLGDDELVDELKTLLVAGHETTATAIGWAADILAHLPESAAAMRETPAAAAKEVLRLRTIIPVSSARLLLEPVDGVPAGTGVLVDALSLHGDPELHPEPRAFRPERFANGGPPPYSYLPFGGGAHRCLGASLANLELETAIASIADRFVVEPAGPPAKPIRRGVTLIPSGGATVRVRPR